MGVNSGKYRLRFSLLKLKIDEFGKPLRDEYGQPTNETELILRPWCKLINIDSNESISTSITEQVKIAFETRYTQTYDNPDTKMFINFENKIYDIVSAYDPDKRRVRTHIVAILRR